MSQLSESVVPNGHGRDAVRTDLADLANAVLHEFNNALNSIAINLAVMEKKGISAELQPEVNTIRREVALIGMKARRLQEICQVTPLRLEAVELNRVVHKVVEMWRGQNERLDLRLNCTPRPTRARARQAELERVLVLLLEDAAAALNGGAGHIIVSTADAGEEIELRVRDSGPSLARGMEARLFEPFTPGRTGGDGLRLSLCKALVKRLQGNIHAENPPEGGVAVVVRLQAAT